MLSDQRVFDQVARDRLQIEAGEVHQRHAEFTGCADCDRAGVGHGILNEESHELRTLRARLLARFGGGFEIDDLVVDQASGQAAERNGVGSHLAVQSFSLPSAGHSTGLVALLEEPYRRCTRNVASHVTGEPLTASQN